MHTSQDFTHKARMTQQELTKKFPDEGDQLEMPD